MGEITSDIQDELQALKRTVGNFNDELTRHSDEIIRCNDEIARCNDEIANLLAKNTELEAKNIQLEAKNARLEDKNLDAEKAISRLQTQVENKNGINHQDDDEIAMNLNAYTFLYTTPIWSGPFVSGLILCLMQYSVFSLFLLDLLNTTKIPPDVATIVRACQIMAIIIAFLVETDMLRALRAVIYREGFEEMASTFDGFAPLKFYASNALMGMEGLLGKVVAFFLIIFADNVFDLLLNFTAVMFVSELDEIFFLLSRSGYVGSKSERLAKTIFKTRLPQKPPNGILRHLHLFLYGVTMVVAVVAFGSIAGQQNSQKSLQRFVKVQFGDEADPTLGLFSGCYEKQLNDGWDARVRYIQVQADRGQGDFEYCLDDGLQTWVFANDTSETACDDDKFVLRSAEERSTSFDLLDAKGDQWLLRTGNPISEFQLGELDANRFEIECGNIAINGATGTSSSDELCPILTIDPGADGFSGSHDWSRSFKFLENSRSEVVQFYQHPVFVGESLPDSDGYEVLFFSGRRWVLATASHLLTEGNPANKTDIISLFESSDFWLLGIPENSLSYLSEAVSQDNDRGTPLGLQWYNTRYAEGVAFPFADISRRPIDASFRCGKCNNRTNPCLHEGICEDDGTCSCDHGASGKLCEIKPLGDGVCNLYFNTEPDGYDGGDCCVSTCSKINCGVGDMSSAFGQSLLREGVGFPHCTDPSMVPLTIYLETETAIVDGSFFYETFTVAVLCEEGTKAALRVALDPTLGGKRNETLYLGDKAESCLLSFIGMTSSIGQNVSYQIVDGTNAGADLVMKEESSVTADGVFPMPALYMRCLKETLGGVIDKNHFYTGSYHDKAFAWLNKEASKNADCSWNEEYLIERYALVAMSTAEKAPESWISSRDHCLWPRVKCDGSRVVELDYDGHTNGPLNGTLAPEFTLLRNLERFSILENQYFQGTIPEEISELTALTSLLLGANQRTGTIPSAIFEFPLLQELSLGVNAISGTIPLEVGNLSTLTVLTLHYNKLSGTVPSEIGNLSGLTILSLFSNAFSGTLPSEIWSLSDLEGLSAFGNAFNGTIPKEIGNLVLLHTLELSSNAFSGTIPSEVGNLSALTSLSLFDNAFSGNMPSEVGYLSALQNLDLSGNAFSGTFPSEGGNLSSLTSLILYKNTFSGGIPSEVGKLRALTMLSLYDNALSGTIPSEVSNLSALTSLELSGNLLSGKVPAEVGNMRSLQFISLDTNGLSGSIPSEVGNLSGLTKLYMGTNEFSGTLPSELGKLDMLNVLSVSVSALSGIIPSELGNLVSLSVLSLYNNVLSGTIPSELGNLRKLQGLSLHTNSLSGTIPSEVGFLTTLTEGYFNKNALSGRIPSEVGNLNSLSILYLYANVLSGTIPSEVRNLSALKQLWLDKNALSGTIPTQLWTLERLQAVSIGDNMLTGSISPELGKLTDLLVLVLSDNQLVGSIPPDLATLSAITWIDLSNNQMTGSIPPAIGNWRSLNNLALSNNAFTGTIPSEAGLLVGLTNLDLSNCSLTGTIPTEIGLLTNLQNLILGGNKLGGSLPAELQQLTSLSGLDLSGNLFSEEEVNNVMIALGLVFTCNETTVEVVLTTDDWPVETRWGITTDGGSVVASGDGYLFPKYAYDEKVCVPSDACTFILLDQYNDGGPTAEISRLGEVYQIGGNFTDKVVVNICA